MGRKEDIREFKRRADVRNKILYQDIASFKYGLMLLLAIVSVLMLYYLVR
jgi:hypothetical protein